LAFDSRKAFSQSDTLFIALKSNSNDGHKYIEGLIAKGHQTFLVHKEFNSTAFKQASFIKVADTLEALHALASYHRKK